MCAEYGWTIDYISTLNITQINKLMPRDEEAEEEANKGESINSAKDFQKVMEKRRELRKKENGI